jgi:hypothetical protein
MTRSTGACALLAAAFAFTAPLSAQSAPQQFDPITVPAAEPDSGVFVSQIGNGNRTDANQQTNSQFARIIQDGADNTADIDQRGEGEHFASIAQTGNTNLVLALQDGNGQSALLLAQQGNGNSADIGQTDNGLLGPLGSAAAIFQSGDGNSLILVQNGSDNQARLTQNGDNNDMTATQLDTGNRLDWTQDGSGLSDLQITQEGGAVMQITQTNMSSAGGSN